MTVTAIPIQPPVTFSRDAVPDALMQTFLQCFGFAIERVKGVRVMWWIGDSIVTPYALVPDVYIYPWTDCEVVY